WSAGNLQNRQELDYIPCRLHWESAQGNNQVITRAASINRRGVKNQFPISLLAGKFTGRLFLGNLVQGMAPFLGFERGFGEAEDLGRGILSRAFLATFQAGKQAVVRRLQGGAPWELRLWDEVPAKIR